MFKLYGAKEMNKLACKTKNLNERADDHLEALSKQIYEAASAGKFSIQYKTEYDDDAIDIALATCRRLGYNINPITDEYIEIDWREK